ncbi:membrane cofactor protein isoform X15 [Labrus bergylta]|uniref:membrane cofactor protein isoform X15 n=1 Tax=Labrus bergylta TaxID=56723 RepID=UPI0033140EE7
MAVCLVFLLSSLGLAITAQAQDCPKPVPGPNMNLKGNDIVLQEFPDGTKVTFTCEVGYQSAGGSGVSTCSAGNWSPVRLQCERKNCGALEAVINGDITYPTSTLFGDTAVVTCNAGYRRVGRETIRCGDAGWLDRLPVCEVSKCGPPPAIADGTFYPEKEEYEYREVVRYTCQKDLTLNGSKSVSCSEDGTFTPAAPTCIKVQCKAPNIDNADFTSGSRYPYKYKATVTHQCRTGYMMIGQSTSVCGIDGQWSPKLLECKPKNCSKPVGGVNMNLKDRNTPTFPHGTSVTFVCDAGYESAGGSAVTTCTTGNWSPVTLKCVKKLPTPTTTDKPGGKEGDGDGGTDNGGSSTGTTVGIIIGCVAGLFLVVLAIYYFKKKKKAGFQKGTAENETTGDGNSVELQSGKHSAAVGTTLLNEKTSD